MSVAGCNSFKAFAIATAGKMCPPVPPPAIIIFTHLLINFLLLLRHRHFFVFYLKHFFLH